MPKFKRIATTGIQISNFLLVMFFLSAIDMSGS